VGYYDEYGNLIDSVREARRHYVSRWDGLTLDLIAVFPMELLANFLNRHLALYHLIRIIHIKLYFKSLQSRINIKYDVFRNTD